MLYDELKKQAGDPDRLAIVTPKERVSWGELQERVETARIQVAELLPDRENRRLRVGFQVPADIAGVAGLAALDQLGCDAFLIDDMLDDAAAERLATDCRLSVLLSRREGSWTAKRITEDSEAGADTDTENSVTILTSGTEGKPKAAAHTWTTLARPVRRLSPEKLASSPPQVWLASFRVQLYAGLQVMLQALLNQGTLVMPEPGAAPNDVVGLMQSSGVTHASATPSYWRRLVLFADREALVAVPLRQITLGGEAADQQILDALSEIFPAARVAHIYATTELGRCFSVTDGKAGFLKSWLDGVTDDSVELRVEEDQLFVRSANAMTGYDTSTEVGEKSHSESDGWVATGDLVQVTDDRVLFAGRGGDMINVGGNKVRPLAVEAVVRSVPYVADCRVFAKSSSIAGQLVACEFVAADGADVDELKKAIAAACREKLAGFECPRFLAGVDQLALSAAGKTRRQE